MTNNGATHNEGQMPDYTFMHVPVHILFEYACIYIAFKEYDHDAKIINGAMYRALDLRTWTRV